METEYAEFTSLESTYGSTAPSTLGCTVVEDTGMGTDGWKNCKGLDKKKKELVCVVCAFILFVFMQVIAYSV